MYEAYDEAGTYVADAVDRNKLISWLKENGAQGTYILKKVMGKVTLREKPSKLVADIESFETRNS